MRTSYNRIAGHTVERIAALSDGIFAVAMTLLVFDLRVPAREAVAGDRELWHALGTMAPQFLTYVMSFLTLGIFWHGQQVQLTHIARSNRHLSWLNLAFLATVTMMPFSTRLLTEFIHYRAALLCYWANIVLPGLMLYWIWLYAVRAGLVKEGTTPETDRAIRRRLVTAQALCAAGALLCVFDNYASIAFIVLVQLNFAIGLSRF